VVNAAKLGSAAGRLKIYGFQGEPFKSASVKTASNEIQKTPFGQRQHTRNQKQGPPAGTTIQFQFQFNSLLSRCAQSFDFLQVQLHTSDFLNTNINS
jgi:hypothetical protein